MQKTNNRPDETWTIARLISWIKDYFEEKGIESPRLGAELLLSKVLNCDRVSLYTNFDKPLTKEELSLLRSYIKRRVGYEPVSYITCEKSFFELDLYVDKNVLIPRPDTERLIEVVQERFESRVDDDLNIIDLGTGSGAIALSLAYIFKNSSLIATDISEKALEIAKKNSVLNGLGERVVFIHSNWFENIDKNLRFDIIASNPPYIRREEIKELQPEVRIHEPMLALDGGNDGLDCYRVIIDQAESYLNEKGILVFEIGFDQGEDMEKLCCESGKFHLDEIVRDYGDRDRVAVLKKKCS